MTATLLASVAFVGRVGHDRCVGHPSTALAALYLLSGYQFDGSWHQFLASRVVRRNDPTHAAPHVSSRAVYSVARRVVIA